MDKKYIVKASYQKEMRRFQLDRQEKDPDSYNALKTEIQAKYGLSSVEPLVLKYTDDEGDSVAFSSSEELAEALRISDVLTEGGYALLRVKVETPSSSSSSSDNLAMNNNDSLNLLSDSSSHHHQNLSPFSSPQQQPLHQHQHHHPHQRHYQQQQQQQQQDLFSLSNNDAQSLLPLPFSPPDLHQQSFIQPQNRNFSHNQQSQLLNGPYHQQFPMQQSFHQQQLQQQLPQQQPQQRQEQQEQQQPQQLQQQQLEQYTQQQQQQLLQQPQQQQAFPQQQFQLQQQLPQPQFSHQPQHHRRHNHHQHHQHHQHHHYSEKHSQNWRSPPNKPLPPSPPFTSPSPSNTPFSPPSSSPSPSPCQKPKKQPKKKEFSSRFVKHVTIPDNTQLPCNRPFTKTWRFRNEGSLSWPSPTSLLFISRQSGDLMHAPPSVPLPTSLPVPPDGEIDVSVDFITPSRPGLYAGFWRLCLPDGKKFGQRVWVKIQAVEGGEEGGEGEKEKGEVVLLGAGGKDV